ncbi:MAG: hypothetical protein KUL88_14140 [Rhizobium sp.]|nr:hypothetical protein [Rhizobium sp.]
MTDSITNAAVLTAEISLDLFEIAVRDTINLEAAARALVWAAITDADPIGHAYQVAAAAVELEAKLSKMANVLRPLLGEVIVAHRDDDATAVH